jgi:hypothetical protein
MDSHLQPTCVIVPPLGDAMADEHVTNPSWARRLFGDFNPLRVLGGTVLAILVLLAAFSAVIFFSAAQFQSRVAELTLNGAPLTIWRINAFRDEFVSWRKDLEGLRNIIKNGQQKLAESKGEIPLRQANQLNLETHLIDDIVALKTKLIAASPNKTVSSSQEEHGISSLVTDVELLMNTDALRSQYGNDVQDFKKRVNELNDSRTKINMSVAELEGVNANISLAQDTLKERVEAAAKLFGNGNTTPAPELVERITNITAELEALSKVWRGIIYDTALWTNDMLVLLLLISMGVLGAALNLLAIFFTDDKESLSFGEYPLRLAFGAVLAIVMFIIAKAGVPILADTSKIGGNAPLNPYFISLLAIVSGLMSDRSMAAIRNVANNILQSVGGVEFTARYTRVVLDDALKTANRDVVGLSRLLGLDEPETRKLFSGNDVVSPDRQKLISAYLALPARELFTDQPAG